MGLALSAILLLAPGRFFGARLLLAFGSIITGSQKGRQPGFQARKNTCGGGSRSRAFARQAAHRCRLGCRAGASLWLGRKMFELFACSQGIAWLINGFVGAYALNFKARGLEPAVGDHGNADLGA